MTRYSTRQKVVPDSGYSWPELVDLLGATLEARLSALVLGHPGVGKSALARQLAEGVGLPLIDIRLAQQEPADLAGVYFPDEGRTRLDLLPPQWVQEACAQPSFIFLDEFNAAVSRLHQAVAYQIVLERRVGPFVFHPDTVVLAAGNLEEDQALATSLSSALCNRFVHFQLRVDAPSWLAWARAAGIDEGIVAYVARHGEQVLYQRDEGAQAFPSPRSWALASALLKRVAPARHRQAVAACVGRPAAEAFYAFQRLYGRVNPERILKRGELIDFTKGREAELSFLHAAVYSVADWLRNEGHLTEQELPNVARFLKSPGLDPEYAILFLRQLRGADKLLRRLRCCPEFRFVADELVQLHAGLYAA